jgi:hypothetical protein
MLNQMKPKTMLSYKKHVKDFTKHHYLKDSRVETFTQEELNLYSDYLNKEYKKLE